MGAKHEPLMRGDVIWKGVEGHVLRGETGDIIVGWIRWVGSWWDDLVSRVTRVGPVTLR